MSVKGLKKYGFKTVCVRKIVAIFASGKQKSINISNQDMKKTLLLAAMLAFFLPAVAGVWETEYPRVEKSIVQPTFADKTYDVRKFGAKPGADAAKNQKAINKAIEKCSKKGGGTVIVDGGTYDTGAIRMLSNVNLHIAEGSTIHFVFQPELYPQVLTRWEGLDLWNLSPCIYAYGEKNIALTGKGVIDGGAEPGKWWNWVRKERFGWKEGMPSQNDPENRPRLLALAEDGVDMNERRFTEDNHLRPQLVNFNKCENVLMEDLTLLNSPFWVIHPLLCKNFTARGLHINNDGPNGDGCDPESCDGVLIENCYFNTGDDCIAVKSGRNADGRLWNTPTQNMIVRNCEMRNGHGGLVLGSEISGGCRNIFVENCNMDSPNLDRVIRIKTNTCRGGLVEKLYVRNITVGQCKEAVLKINLDYENREICCRGYLPTVRDIYLDNVTCQKSKYGVMIIGLDTVANVRNIHLDNCHFNGVADGNSIKGKVDGLYFNNCYINNSLVLDKKPYDGKYSRWMAASEMKRQPKSYMLDYSKRPKWSYAIGVELDALFDTYLKYGDKEILDYCTLYTDTMINEDGVIRGYKLEDYNLDNIRPGHFLTNYEKNFPQKKNAKAIATLMSQLEKQPRTQDGPFWHKAIYAHQVWLDGIFMGLPFRVLNASKLSPKKAKAIYDDAVDQLVTTYNRTFDPKTGLNRHAWDSTGKIFWADPETGLSKHCWGRAQGWYTMACVEVLDALPADYARRGEVEELLEKSLAGIMKWQDKKSKLWYQVMDAPGREGNYLEATASSMFAYSMLKAARKGYVDPKYLEKGKEAYQAILDTFIRVNPDKTISLTDCCAVAGLGPEKNPRRDGSFAYYLSEPVRDNDAKGLGPFIWASLEMEQMAE